MPREPEAREAVSFSVREGTEDEARGAAGADANESRAGEGSVVARVRATAVPRIRRDDGGSVRTDAELEAVLAAAACVLGAGGDGTRRALARLVGRDGLARLARRDADDLARETGWRPRRCRRLVAAFALGRLVEADRWAPTEPLRDPSGVHRMMRARLRGLEREQFHVLLLDGKHRLRRVARVSEGTLTTSLVHPREVFRDAVREAAAAVMVVHNHPSGDPEPSREDLEVTERLARAGRLLGIPLLDHLVVGAEGYVSLRERGWLGGR